MDCSYCNVNKRSTDKINPDLYLAEYHKLRKAFPQEKIQLDFFGGEPLMQLDMIKQIIAAVEHDPEIQYFMPTNGMLLTDEIVDYIIDKDIDVSVSFDGLWQDKHRLQVTGKKTAQRLLDKKDIIRRIPDLRIHTMVTRGCYNLLENHLFIKEHFGVDPELTLVRDVGTWTESSVNNLKTGIKEFFDWYIQDPSGPIPGFIAYYLSHFLKYHIKKEIKHNCGAGTDMFSFSENALYPCTRFKNRPELLAEIPKYAQMSECQSCEVRYYCEKGCLFEQIKNNGPIVELCTIYKFLYAEVSRLVDALRDDQQFKAKMMEEVTNAEWN